MIIALVGLAVSFFGAMSVEGHSMDYPADGEVLCC